MGQVRVGEWKSLTSAIHINTIVGLGDSLVCGTNGGLLIFHEDSGFESLTNLDGLEVTSLKTLFKDSREHIWLSGDGIVQVYNIREKTSLAVFDLDLDEVIGFDEFKGVIYGAYRQGSHWGISEFIYSKEKYYYRDLYEHPHLSFISVIEATHEHIILGTENGLLVGNPHESHIAQWNYPLSVPSSAVRALSEKNGTLAVVTEEGVYGLTTNGIWTLFQKVDFEDIPLKNIHIYSDNHFLAISDDRLIRITEDTAEDAVDNTQTQYKFNTVYFKGSSVVIGTDLGLVWKGEELNYSAPDHSILSNPDVVASFPNGNLIAGNSKGLSILEPDGWKNFITRPLNITPHQRNKIQLTELKISLGSHLKDLLVLDSETIVLGYAGGLVLDGDGGVAIINFTNVKPNITIAGYPEIPSFFEADGDLSLHVLDMETDKKSNVWIITDNTENKPLSVFNGENWKSFSVAESGNTLTSDPTAVTIDNFNRVWVGKETGLTMVKITGDVLSPETQTWVTVEVNPGFQNRSVLDLAVSPKNRLFVLTPIGLFYKDLQVSEENPVLAIGPLTPEGQLYPYFPNVSFQEGARVRIDPKGNVWASSESDGVHILLENGELWPGPAGLRKENSDLLSNHVKDISFNQEDGLAYIATNRGMSVLRIPFANEKKSFSEIEIFPSPYRIPNQSPMVITNLMDNSSVKIMTLNGKVIRTLTVGESDSHGYQVFWDGLNDEGKFVGSGVYLVAMYNTSGDTGIEKITVIRQ